MTGQRSAQPPPRGKKFAAPPQATASPRGPAVGPLLLCSGAFVVVNGGAFGLPGDPGGAAPTKRRSGSAGGCSESWKDRSGSRSKTRARRGRPSLSLSLMSRTNAAVLVVASEAFPLDNRVWQQIDATHQRVDFTQILSNGTFTSTERLLLGSRPACGRAAAVSRSSAWSPTASGTSGSGSCCAHWPRPVAPPPCRPERQCAFEHPGL